MRKTPLKSARRRDCLWTSGRRFASSTSPQEQNQKQRTFDVLPNPDNSIRYRQTFSPSRPHLAASIQKQLALGLRCGRDAA